MPGARSVLVLTVVGVLTGAVAPPGERERADRGRTPRRSVLVPPACRSHAVDRLDPPRADPFVVARSSPARVRGWEPDAGVARYRHGHPAPGRPRPAQVRGDRRGRLVARRGTAGVLDHDRVGSSPALRSGMGRARVQPDPPAKILGAQAWVTGLAWGPGGSWLLASAEWPNGIRACGPAARTGILRFGSDGSHRAVVADTTASSLDLSADGRRLVYRGWLRTCHACGEIWRSGADGSRAHVIAMPRGRRVRAVRTAVRSGRGARGVPHEPPRAPLRVRSCGPTAPDAIWCSSTPRRSTGSPVAAHHGPATLEA